MRKAVIGLALLAIAIGAFALWGGIDRVTEQRVHSALIRAGLPSAMADCMAPKMVERLSIEQLRALERAKARDNENAVPLSTSEALARIRRIDDPEAVAKVVRTAGGCAFETVVG